MIHTIIYFCERKVSLWAVKKIHERCTNIICFKTVETVSQQLHSIRRMIRSVSSERCNKKFISLPFAVNHFIVQRIAIYSFLARLYLLYWMSETTHYHWIMYVTTSEQSERYIHPFESISLDYVSNYELAKGEIHSFESSRCHWIMHATTSEQSERCTSLRIVTLSLDYVRNYDPAKWDKFTPWAKLTSEVSYDHH